MKKALSYKRFSDKKQDGNTSIERQYKAAVEVCQRFGWQLIDLPPDKHISASKQVKDKDGNTASANKVKGELGKFLAKVKAGDVEKGSVLIIDDVSRFSRNEDSIEVLNDLNSLLKKEVELYSCASGDHITLVKLRENPHILHGWLGAIIAAGQYTKELTRKVNASLDIKREMVADGKTVVIGGWVPYWLDFVPDVPLQPGQKIPVNATGTFKFNKNAITMENIIKQRLDEEWSFYRIVNYLNERKTPTARGGKRWLQNTVSQALRKKVLIGTATFKGVEYPNYYPALITQERWDALQLNLKLNMDRKAVPRADCNVNNLFAGKCKCKCGGPVNVFAPSHNARKKWRNWYCAFTCLAHKAGDGCDITDSINTDEVELDFFMNVLQEPTGSFIAGNTKEVNTETIAAQARLHEVEKTMDKVMDLKNIADMPQDKLASQLAALEKERVDLKNQLAQLNTDKLTQQGVPGVYADIKHIIKTLDNKDGRDGKAWRDYDNAAKKLDKELKDQNVRRQLLPLILALVKRVDFDLELRRYKVSFNDGRVTEWRDLDLPNTTPFQSTPAPEATAVKTARRKRTLVNA